VSADKEAWSQLPQEGSSTGQALDDASDVISEDYWEKLAQEDQAARLQLAQDQAAWLQLAREKQRSASSDHLPGSEAPSRVEDALPKWARKGFDWAGKRLRQATGSRDGGLEWHSWIRRDRRDRAPEKREKAPTKARQDPQPVSSKGKGKGKESADKIPDWATVLQEARASAPQQPAQVVESAEVARPNSPHLKEEEKRRRIAAKEKKLTESRGGAGVKGKNKENGSDGNGGMSF
jgi:hypothetical protein